MKRTTLALDDDLLRQLKHMAAESGTSVQSVANRLLRLALLAPPPTEYRLELSGWSAEVQPGVDLNDRDSLFDLMDGR